MTESTESKVKIKKLLAEQLGISPEDIHDEDDLQIDLHMSAADITDFMETLTKKGFEVSTLDIGEVESLEELIDTINLKVPI